MTISSSSESSESDSTPPSPLIKRATAVKPKPPLITVQPDYVPRIPDRLPSDASLSPLGSAINISDGCVIVQSRPNVPTLDAGTSLFLEGGEPLGEIYETFGPVVTPLYIIVLPNSPCLTKTSAGQKPHISRMKQSENVEHVLSSQCPSEGIDGAPSSSNATLEESMEQTANRTDGSETLGVTSEVDVMSPENLSTDGLQSVANKVEASVPLVHPGDVVYFVKDDPELTIPVFYSQLVQMKGSDASWVNDTEPPPEELEFSDDEQERQHKRNLRSKRRNPPAESNTSVTNYKQHFNNRLIRGGKSKTRCGKSSVPACLTNNCVGETPGAQSNQIPCPVSVHASGPNPFEWTSYRMPRNWRMCELPQPAFRHRPAVMTIGEWPVRHFYGPSMTPGGDYGVPVFNRASISHGQDVWTAPMHSHPSYNALTTNYNNGLNLDHTTFGSFEPYPSPHYESSPTAPGPYRPIDTLNQSFSCCDSNYFERMPSSSWSSSSTSGCPNAATYGRFSRPTLCQNHPLRMLPPGAVSNSSFSAPIPPADVSLHTRNPNGLG